MLALALVMALAEPPRVVAARASKMSAIHAAFDAVHVAYPPARVYLRAFKQDRVVELWAGGKDGALALVKSFPICASSGTLGPKHKQGDLQVPEGFYDVDKLNPFSTYHLALHVDYPNARDRARGKAEKTADLGGDIMVHGNCVTIGCIPLEDDPIEELYLVVADAHLPSTPIAIFPARNLDALTAPDDETRRFWQDELAPVLHAFDLDHRAPHVIVAAGRYVLK